MKTDILIILLSFFCIFICINMPNSCEKSHIMNQKEVEQFINGAFQKIVV